jgi:hypothetical protein
MNSIKKIIKNPLIVLIIAALVGGFFGSYFTYRLNNLSTEKRNKEITKQLMLFIHHEIYRNAGKISQYNSLLDMKGLELINLRAGNLTIKDKQLNFLIRMYAHFSIFNDRISEYIEAQSKPDFIRNGIYESIHGWRDICFLDIEGYEKEFCKDESLKSEIEVE